MSREETRSARTVPHDAAAEEALVGAMMLDRSAIEDVLPTLSAEDFYAPKFRRIYAAIAQMHAEGVEVDAVTLSGALTSRGELDAVGGDVALVELLARAGYSSNAKAYAGRIVRCAQYRKLIASCNDVMTAAYEQTSDPGELVDLLSVRGADLLGSDIVEAPSDLWVMDEFLDRPEIERPSWVIPGLLRSGWRVMVVAAEGVGKTTLMRQIGMAAAQGIHPFRFHAIDPCRTLIVDLENPDDSIVDVCNPIRAQVRTATRLDYDPDRAWLWHRPGGINLRSRRDRSEFEAVLAHTRPSLVCLGPIYKCYRVEAREQDEQAAADVMAVFDDLRTRYGFALMMEHHAPKGSGGTRDLMPYGSSLWLRWPEIGLKLDCEDDANEIMQVGRWRGDRLENEWPNEIHRSRPWPWRAIDPRATPRVEAFDQEEPFRVDAGEWSPTLGFGEPPERMF